jgi:hypothetical protein
LLSAYVSIGGLDADVAAGGGVAAEGEDGDG